MTCAWKLSERRSCGSMAFNLHQDDIDQGALCDVHYWESIAHRFEMEAERLRDLMEAVALIENKCPWCSRNLFARKAPHEPTCPAFTLTGDVK